MDNEPGRCYCCGATETKDCNCGQVDGCKDCMPEPLCQGHDDCYGGTEFCDEGCIFA